MKRVIHHRYGAPEVMELTEVEVPTPKDNEVLIKVKATSVTATEATFRRGDPYMARLFTGLRAPKIKTLGEELSGEVVAVGKEVSTFHPGDQVFGTAGPRFGANAEYICVAENGVLAMKPSNLSHEEAASSVDGFLTALPFLRDKGHIKAGQRVLINGASGSVGSAAVQIAKYYGAEVTGVCSTTNLLMVRNLGADHVIDYTKENFTGNGKTYDIIFDAVGKISFPRSKRSLSPNGIFLEAGIGLGVLRHVIWTSLFGKKKARIAATGLRSPKDRLVDLELLRELMEAGTIKPVIDRSYRLEEIVEAHRYVDAGRKRGNVAILVG
jgi:NADPH:quinone reductase-like Zn-dependent oxidoreductase